MFTAVIVIVLIAIAWSLWGLFSSRVEHTEYSVTKQADGYEIRVYPAHVVAQTTVSGSYEDALRQGFRIVAGYIFGGNARKESISMTSPVVEKSARGESIAMTSPVVASIEGDPHTIAFGMPRSYTLESLPRPTDPRVHLALIPEEKMAALRFSWMRTTSRVESKKRALLAALARDGITVVGTPQYAGYNAPWTPPWMTRHEVLVAVQ